MIFQYHATQTCRKPIKIHALKQYTIFVGIGAIDELHVQRDVSDCRGRLVHVGDVEDRLGRRGAGRLSQNPGAFTPFQVVAL